MPVYFIQDGGPEGEIKIGFSLGDPVGRLRSFRTGNPRPLKLLVAIPGGAREEAALHVRFKDLRGQGEWFRADARLLGFVEGLLAAHPDQPKDDGRAEEAPETIGGLGRGQLEVIAGYVEGRDLQCRASAAARGREWDLLAVLNSALGVKAGCEAAEVPLPPYLVGLFAGVPHAELDALAERLYGPTMEAAMGPAAAAAMLEWDSDAPKKVH